MQIIFWWINWQFFGGNGFAAVTRYDINLSHRQVYSLSEVCAKSQVKHLILPEVLNASSVSCGIQTIKALDFCLQWRQPDALLIRAFADRTAKEVRCEYGSRAIFSYACDNGQDPTCQLSSRSCQKLRSTIAYDLELVHQGVNETRDGRPTLNCFFDRPLEFPENSFLLQKKLEQ